MKRQIPLVIACALSASFGALMTSTSPVFADGNPATDTVPRYVPYKGTLEKDGVGYSGTVGMTFKLYDGTSTTAAWTESQTVTVYSGAFQVLLGAASTASATSLTEVLKDADDVYLSVSLTTSSGTVDLSNKQRLMPTPYAIWTTSSTDFSVGDDLDVDGDAVIDATLTVGGAFKANTTAEIVSTSKFTGNASFESTTDSNGSSSAPVVIGSNSTQKLYVDGNEIDSTGSALSINTNSSQAVTVGGALTANSTASIKGGTVTLDNATSNVVSWGTAGSNTPSSSSTGWKAKTYGNQSGIGISSSAQWYASNGSHVWYSTSDSGTTFTQRMSLDNAGLLTATGAIQPSVGNSTANGIQFTQNYGGGSGDTAYLRYYVDDSTENMRLILGIDNDTDDDLVLYQGGANRIQLASGEVYMLTKVGYGSCPSGYTLSNNMCYKMYTSGKAWMEAQSTCHSDGGHICTMAEAYILWGSGSCSDSHNDNYWLGDLVSDDYPLHVNSECSKSNFENDDDNKTSSKAYTCCINLR